MNKSIHKINSVCVTGGAGFIGSEIVRQLVAQGRKVTVIDDLSVGLRENIPDGVEFVHGDIQEAEIAAIAAQSDALIHLAARVAIRSSFEFIVEDTSINVVGTASLLRALSSSESSVKKCLFASSMAVYADGNEDEFMSESHDIVPLSPYGTSKYAAELLVKQVCEKSGIDAGILRLFNTYGTGQALSPYVGVVTIFANAMRKGDTPKIFGDGEQMRDFVHVQDVAQAFIKALDTETKGQVFNVGSGKGFTVNQVYKLIAGVLGFSPSASHVEAVPGEARFSVADIAKARQILGYKPVHNFAESIESVVNEI